MIPKIIHYCWFGGNPLPELAEKCINSWKRYFPEYEIKEWNENNFDLDSCEYVREAYNAKKWAFVSDYVRLQVLYQEGGIYFDTDVEVIKDMEDILIRGPFMGCEEIGVCGPGLVLCAEPKMTFYKEILDDYRKAHFMNANGSINYKTIVERITETLKEYGFKELNELQMVAGIYIYPKDFFCPLDYETGKLSITENTRSIHWYDASWFDERMKKRRYRNEKIRNFFPEKMGIQLSKWYMRISYYLEWLTTGRLDMIVPKIASRLFKSGKKKSE